MKFLSYSSRFRTYVETAGTYLTASLLSSLLSVLINPLMAMNLSPEDYAVSTYYSSFSQLYSPILGFFIVDYYLRKYYLLSKEDLYKLKGNIIKLFLFFSGAVSIICLFALYAFVKGTDVSFDFLPYAVLAILHAYLNLNYVLQLSEYKIARQPKQYFRASLVFGVLNVLLSLLLVVVFKFGAVGKMLAPCIGAFTAFVWVLYKNREYLIVKLDLEIFKQILIYGYPLVLAAMLSYFTSGYDKALLERGGDIITLGYYAVACNIANYINVFSNAIKATFQPDMYKAISEHNIKKVLKVAMLVILSVGALVAIFVVFCPWIIKILTAGRYIKSTPICRIVVLSSLTSTIYYQVAQFTYGTGHSKVTLVNKIIGTLFNIGLMIFLVKKWGAIGAAWGTVLGFVVFAVINILILFTIRKKLFNKS